MRRHPWPVLRPAQYFLAERYTIQGESVPLQWRLYRQGKFFSGGHNELTNIEVVNQICELLDQLSPSKLGGIKKYSELIRHVEDRFGHDGRYAIDASKLANDLGWTPEENFASGIEKTVRWYLENIEWCRAVTDTEKRKS